LALGIGLTALMFYSSRHGYDEAVHGEGDGRPRASGNGGDSAARPDMPPRRIL
jgi:hypothetical protein